MTNIRGQLLLFLVFWVSVGCKTDYQNLPAFSDKKQWQAVVETPSGNTVPMRYDAKEKTFVPVTEAGRPRVMEFLPYLGNHGFIPSTSVDTAVGQPAAPLPVLVLSERKEPGTVLEILPVAVLITERDDIWHHLIIAVPARPTEQTISPISYADFSARYPAVKAIVQQWYLAENRHQPTRLVGWRDGAFAEQLIQRWVK